VKRGPRVLAVALATVFMSACSAPVVAPADGERCADATAAALADKAVAALRVVPFVRRELYDVDAAGKGVSVPVGEVPTGAIAVITYPFPKRFAGGPEGFERLANRSYTYDNALYALLMTARGERDKAAGVLATLAALQRGDGAWGFSFDAHKTGFCNRGYVRTGVVAWTIYAYARFAGTFGDKRFAAVLSKAAKWLDGRRDATTGLVLGGMGRWLDQGKRFDPAYVADWASTEHNVDAYFAVRELERLGIRTSLSSAALGQAIADRLYIAEERRYAQGVQPGGLDRVSALDAAGTWTALFELARGKPQRASYLLAWIDTHHRVQDGGWRGFKPYRKGPDVWFVEGSLGRALVDLRLGRTRRAGELLAEVARLACVGDVPLLYSTSWAPDFPASPAAAPTLWFALVARELGGGDAFLWR